MKYQNFLLIACLAGMAAQAIAQEAPAKVKFMDHLAVSIEASTAGIGVEAATNLHPNAALRAGFVFLPPVSKKETQPIWLSGDMFDEYKELDRLIMSDDNLYEDLKANGLPTSTRELDNEVLLKSRLNWYNGKLLVDYYPSAKKLFHITAGLYFGTRDTWIYTGQASAEYTKAIRIINGHLPDIAQVTPMVSDDALFGCEAEVPPSGKIRFTEYTLIPVKPYIGIGFGRTVPRQRIGCQLDIGCMYAGKPGCDNGGYKVNEYSNWTKYPFISHVLTVISLRLTGRIF